MTRRTRSALLLVDVIHPFDFDGAKRLLRHARRIVPALLRVREAFDTADYPVVYCNDNFGQWRSEASATVRACTKPDALGADFVSALAPRASDYIVLKPKHSSFAATPLELLLGWARVKRLYIAGLTGDSCVHATAIDARSRDFDVVVISDATASETAARNGRALQQLVDRDAARLIRSMAVGRSFND